MKVLRIYHGGRDSAHRERDRALARAGVDLTLVVPAAWEGPNDDDFAAEPFEVIERPVIRPGDVNRYRFAEPGGIAELVAARRPDVVDLHQEPFSSVVHQVLNSLPVTQPVVCYTAQNIDKRFPPPFLHWERQALGRIQGLYPCSRQAASVAVGKGFAGVVRMLPLASPPEITAGSQEPPTEAVHLLLVGRMRWRKGVLDAVRALAEVSQHCPATLTLAGTGPHVEQAENLAAELGVGDALIVHPWLDAEQLAQLYRQAQIVLTPSRANRTWVEQFGRMVVEAHTAGAVVVGYASGSLPEVVGEAGVLVPEGDVAALSAAVLDLHRDPRRWHSLRAAGQQQAKDWDAIAQDQLELYQQATSATPVQRRVRPQRAMAEATYGPPARISGGGRPFALPYLRQDTPLSRGLARTVDAVSRRETPATPQRLRVVYLDHVAKLSGGELALARLLSALPEVAAHVILAEDGPLRQRLEAGGATVEVLPLNSRAGELRRGQVGAGLGALRAAGLTLAHTLRVAHRLRTLNPDLVHTNSLKSGYYGAIAARLAGRPVVWHLRDRLAPDYLPARAIALTRLLLRHVPDMVLCNSAETLRMAGLEHGRESVLPSPVVYDPYRADAARHEPTSGFVVGMVGRLASWKGQHVFLRAFATAFADQPDARARIVGSAMFGEDDYAAELVRLAAELGLTEQVTFVGFTTEVERELSILDVLVHASVVAEPFGQVVVEGMAAGLPVIAAAAGGPLEVITAEVDGLLVRPDDVAELATALQRLAGDPALRARLGAAGAARAQDFTPEVIGARVTALYRELLTQRGRRLFRAPVRPR